MFNLVQRNILREDDCKMHVFEPEFTELQREVLRLLGGPEANYREGQ